MLLIALIALLAVWGTVVAIVLGICVSAGRGDRELRHEHAFTHSVRSGGKPVLRLVAR